MSKLTLTAMAVLSVLTMGTGCVRRELVAFNDHDTKPLTALRVSVTRSYLVMSSNEYVFYSCLEKNDSLTCKRLCGGDVDVVCPKATLSGDGVATNIR